MKACERISSHWRGELVVKVSDGSGTFVKWRGLRVWTGTLGGSAGRADPDLEGEAGWRRVEMVEEGMDWPGLGEKLARGLGLG